MNGGRAAISAVEQSGLSGLDEGQTVGFEIESDARGPKAVNLVLD